jgi:autophagy-related protein 33
LLIFPSSTTAYQTFNQLSISSNTNVRALSAISSSSLLLAYVVSPRRGRHPYLLWTVLTVLISVGADVLLTTPPRRIESRRKADLDGREINGEEVRKSMEGFRKAMVIKTGILGMGFVMSIVGLWGDGL